MKITRSKGQTIVATAAEAWAAEMVVKVKEPLAEEYGFLREDLLPLPTCIWLLHQN